jgi:hypothetical protein
VSDEVSSGSVPPGLLAIRGIGPALARRLAQLGFGSLERLAAASADDIVSGSTDWPFRPDHERADDWIGQARRLLAAESTGPTTGPRTGRPPGAALPSPRARHTFTLEVQTNDPGEGTAVATRIVDVETQAFDTWSGWDAERITRFVAAHSGSDLPGAVETASEEAAAEEPAARPAPPRDAGRPSVLAFGIVDSPTVVRGGTPVRAVLRLGPDDTATVPEGGAVEWDLAVGAAEGRTTERLARHREVVTPGSPLTTSAEGVVPDRHDRARLIAVVRLLGPGDQPRLARTLTDAHLDVSAQGRN